MKVEHEPAAECLKELATARIDGQRIGQAFINALLKSGNIRARKSQTGNVFYEVVGIDPFYLEDDTLAAIFAAFNTKALDKA